MIFSDKLNSGQGSWASIELNSECCAISQVKPAGLLFIELSWGLTEHHIMIIIIKNHKEKISIEFPESVNLEKSYFKTCSI